MAKLLLKSKQLIRRHWIVLGIVVIFVGLHIPGITTPPIDEHNWRQTDTTAVIRNFSEESPNIFLPRIDMRAQYSGVTGMEFPLYNYIVFIFNKTIGFAHWHGRVITLFFAAVGLLYFYGLVRSRYDESTAVIATGVLAASPLYFLFSKNIQPDLLMVAASIASLYYVDRYVAKHRRPDLYLSWLALAIAILVKIPAVFVGLPYLWLLGWGEIQKLLRDWRTWLAAVIMVVPIGGWYLWSAHLSTAYGLGNYFYGDFSWGTTWPIIRVSGFWHTIVEYIYPTRFPISLVYGLIGLGVLTLGIKWKKLWPLIWLGAIGLFLVLFGSKSFYHNYYALPIMPPLALLVALGFVWLYRNLRRVSLISAIVLAIVCTGMLTREVLAQRRELYPQTFRYADELEGVMDQFSSRHDLVATNWGGNPIMLYFAHRKGWSVIDVSPAAVDGLRRDGVKFLIMDMTVDGGKAPTAAPFPHLQMRYHDSHFTVYQL